MLLVFSGVLLLCTHVSAQHEDATRELPRNIILFIGDGMGPTQLTLLTLIHQESVMNAFPVGGFSLTVTADALITESASSATALSTGMVTARGMIAMTPDGAEQQTLLEYARSCGKATGIVATSAITHATPAGFVAHVKSRNMQYQIAEQMAKSGTDVIMGGGKRFFRSREMGGNRKDFDLVESMEEDGYTVVLTDDESDAISVPAVTRDMKLLVLAADKGLSPANERQLQLSTLVRLAIDVLSQNDEGFVLLVEGSQIDWACHDNDFETLKAELVDFDHAVAVGMAFATKDSSTAVVVTADHETGGLALIGDEADASDIEGKWISESHTAAMIPVLAYGPGSARLGGIHRNDEIGRLLFYLLGRDPF